MMLKEQEATLNLFIQYLDDLKRTKATKKLYHYWLVKLAKAISKPFEEMDSEDLAQFIRLLKNLKPASRNMARNKIHYFFTKFLKLPEIMDHPGLSKEKVPIESPDLLTDNEIQSLIGAAQIPRDKALIAVLVEGGMRVGALAEFPEDSPALKTGPGFMTFGDVEKVPHGYKLHIRHTKTREERYVPILFYAADLKQWLTLHPTQNEKDPLWCYQQKGKLHPLSYEAIYRLITRSAERAGIKKRVHPHLLRKQFASTLKEKYDLDSWDIAQLGGWVPNSSTLRRYIHQNPNAVHERYAKRLGIKEPVEEPKEPPVRKACLNCREVLPPTSVYCPHCGQIQDKETVELHKDAIKQSRRASVQYREELASLKKDLIRQQETIKKMASVFSEESLIQEQKETQKIHNKILQNIREERKELARALEFGKKLNIRETMKRYLSDTISLHQRGEIDLKDDPAYQLLVELIVPILREEDEAKVKKKDKT